MSIDMNEQANWQWKVIEDTPDIPTTSNPVLEAAKYVGRHPARTLARAGEAAVGLPGDLANMALSGVNLLQKPITGQNSEIIETIQQKNPFTSQKIRENITQPLEKNVLPEGYLTPQGKYEELADSFVSDLASILMPVGGAAGLAAKGGKLGKGAVKSAIAVSGLGNVAGFLTKNITGSEKLGDAVKIGTMLGTSLIGIPGMKDMASKGYQSVESMTPDTLKVSTRPLNQAMYEAEKIMAPYRSTKGGKALMDYFKDTLSQVADRPEEKLKTIIELDKGFNKVLWQNPAISYDVKKAKDLIKGAIDSTIKSSGRPDIHQAYKSASTLYREASSAKGAQEWVNGVAHSLPRHGNILSRSARMLLGLPGKAINTAQETARLLEIPEVKRYYMQAAKAAFDRSKPAWIKAANMMSKAVEKQAPIEENWQWKVID
jgi:hypothetical protein